MRRTIPLLAALVLLAGCSVPDVRYREDVPGPHPDPSGNEFVRYDGYGDVSGTLESSITTWRRGDQGPRFHLVGAVHMGDRAYYERLQEFLDSADLVLFELVKPEAADVRAMDMGQGDMYAGIGEVFGLASQVSSIDYARENFRWLDMSAERFGGRMTEIVERARERLSKLLPRGAAVPGLPPAARRALAAAAAALPPVAGGAFEEEDPTRALIRLLLTPLRAEKAWYGLVSTEKAFEDKYKHALAAGLSESGGLDQIEELRGQSPIVDVIVDAIAELWHVILAERNQIVLEGVKSLLDSGEAPADVAIFYGAGHNPGLSEGLRAMGFAPEGEPSWIPVIAIRK